jgi:transcriptional regulator with XRE-family HTH domain
MKKKRNTSTLGGRLRWFLAFRGESIREFADRTGLPYRSLQDYLADRRKPAADQLVLIGDAGVDIHWLLTGRIKPLFGMEGADIEGTQLVCADLELTKATYWAAMDLTDAFSTRRIAAGRKPLSAVEVIDVAAVYCKAMIDTAGRMAETIEKLAAKGASRAEILDIFVGAVANVSDATIEGHLAKIRRVREPDEPPSKARRRAAPEGPQ